MSEVGESQLEEDEHNRQPQRQPQQQQKQQQQQQQPGDDVCDKEVNNDDGALIDDDDVAVAGEECKIEEFVNAGLARWEHTRDHWLAQSSSQKSNSTSRLAGETDSMTNKAAIPLQVDEVIDIIFSPRWRNQGDLTAPPPRFPQNVPLPQMVDVLVDLWEAEGLDM